MTTVIKPDWSANRGGPEEYAPPDQRQTGHPAIQPGNEGLLVTERLEALVGHALGASLDQMDHVIAEMEKTRDMLRNEGEHVGRLVANYVRLSQATTTAMKIISDTLEALNGPLDRSD